MQKLHSSYTTLAVVILVLIICFSFSKKENKSTPPNFIIIYCDDLGYGDLSLNGHPTINTPFLDKMASEGMVFPQFYSGSPACTASRYALLTGKYPNRSGFGWVLNPDSPRGIHPDEITIAELLKTKGYQTGLTYFEKKQYLLFNLEEDPSEKYEIGESNPEIINSLSKELESFLTSSKQQKSFFEK